MIVVSGTQALSKHFPVDGPSQNGPIVAGPQATGSVPFALGNVQFVKVETGLCVANIIGQAGITKRNQTTPPIRYDAIRKGLISCPRSCPYVQRLDSHAPNGSPFGRRSMGSHR